MTLQQLLQVLEPLTYKARLQHMIDLGRQAANNVDIATLLTDLKQGDFYERLLAIQSCYGSYNRDQILRALTDPSRIIRQVAVKLAPMVCDEAQLRQALILIAPKERGSLLWKLHHYRYPNLIDEFLKDLIRKRDPQSLKLLPLGSGTLVRQYIVAFQDDLKQVDWRRLARHHPTIACEILQGQIDASANIDQQLLFYANSIMPIITEREPDAALALVTTLTHYVSLRQIEFQSLMILRPEAIIDLMLERVLKRTSSTDFADTVLPLFVVYQPERAALLIPDLLQDDPSWITRPAISTYLHTYRQDLLTPFLRPQAHQGRFSTGNTNFVLPMQHGFVRWTLQQQEVFALTLLAVIKDTDVRDATIRSAIKQLAVLPALPATHLIALIDDERAVVRDTALFQLSKMDAGQGMPILFRTLHDKSASKVASALRTLCMQVPLPQALTILQQTSLEKVRIAKEVVRILAMLPGEDAYQELLTFDNKMLHRDVRVAFLRSLWYHLDRDEVWQILEREAHSLDGAIVLSTVHMNLTVDVHQHRQRLRGRYRHRKYLRTLSCLCCYRQWIHRMRRFVRLRRALSLWAALPAISH